MRLPAAREALLPAVAAALAFSALFLSAGSSQSRLFWLGLGAVVVAAPGWIVAPPRLSVWGGLFFAALAAFVVWQGASIAWSIEPARSWDYTNRGLVYFAFAAAGALLGRFPPHRLAFAAAVLLGALFAWALAAKVVPGLYPDYSRLARLRYPLGYWNELALLAAASVPLGLWLARRVRVAGALLLYGALVVVVLTFSRVGIVLAVVAVLAWLWFDHERFEVVAPLAVAWIAGAAVSGVALLLPGATGDGEPRSVRLQDGLVFAAVFVVGGLAVAAASRYVLPRSVDRRVVRGVAVALVALFLAAFAGAVVRAGGPVDFVRNRWHEFANPLSAQLENQRGRLVSGSSSNRWRWWQEAWNAFVDHPAQGTGAGTFGLTDRLARKSSLAVVEPHSAPLQNLSETGIVGFLLVVVMIAAAASALRRRQLRGGATLALALGFALCVVHSFVDIDWDFVAVQGPVFMAVGALVTGAAPEAGRRRWLPGAAIAVCALAAVYSLTSPWLSDQRLSAAYDAIARGDRSGARDEAKSAHAFNPLAVEPLWVWAATEPNARALRLFRQARDREPKNPETWFELGVFELKILRRPRDALRDLNRAYTLDRYMFSRENAAGRALDEARCLVDPATCR
jgi:hypothetical protein